MFDKNGYKGRFLASPNKNIQDIKNTFNSIEYFEEFIKKDDLCNFTIDEFSKLVQNLINKRTIGTVEKDISYLRSYLDFCADDAKLSNYDIQNMLDIKHLTVKGWLKTFTENISDSSFYLRGNEMFSLGLMAKDREISYQAAVAAWLFFLGLNVAEVLNLKEADIRDWNNWCRDVSTIPDEIKRQVNLLIESALSDKTSPRLHRCKIQEIPYKKSNYFLKSTHFEDKPILGDTLSHNFDKIRDKFGKSKMRQISIRKSGMLFFGAQLLKEKTIKTYDDLKSLIYEPLYRRFDVTETYRLVFDDIFRNDTIDNALESFYGVVVPELDRAKKFMGYEVMKSKFVHQR